MSCFKVLTDEELVTQFYDKARALAKEDEKLKLKTYVVVDETKKTEFHVRGFYDYWIQFHDTVEGSKANLAYELRMFIADDEIETIDELVIAYVEDFRDMFDY